MPEVRNQLEGDAPTQPHLALWFGDDGSWMAIPPGATIAIIEDPERSDKIFPMVLAKVSLKKIIFVCRCGDPGCNVNYAYSVSKTGHHSPAKRNIGRSSEGQVDIVTNAPSPKKGSR